MLKVKRYSRACCGVGKEACTLGDHSAVAQLLVELLTQGEGAESVGLAIGVEYVRSSPVPERRLVVQAGAEIENDAVGLDGVVWYPKISVNRLRPVASNDLASAATLRIPKMAR